MRTATFDCEANGLLDTATKIWCIAIKDHENGLLSVYGPDDIGNALSCLSTYDILIGHNCIDYDFPLLKKVLGYEYKGKVIDTLVMSRSQQPSRKIPPGFKGDATKPHSVEAWGYRFGRQKISNDIWDNFTPNILSRVVEDVEIQYLIYHELLKEDINQRWKKAHPLNMQLLRYLKRQEEYGWNVDQEYMDKCLTFLYRWIDRIDKAITPRLPLVIDKDIKKLATIKKPFKMDGSHAANVYKYCSDPEFVLSVSGPFSRIGFRPVDLDSNLEVKKYLLSLGWKPTAWNTNNEGRRTSPKFSKDDDFVGITSNLGRLLAKRVQCKQRAGIIEGWIDHIDKDGRIHAGINGFAVTGRLKHKLIVNIPNPETKSFFSGWMRKIFTVTPGMVMIGVDSTGNQIRQLAARMNDDEFTRSILYGSKEQGTDIHTVNMQRAGTNTRTTAKNFFYGLIFGASNRKLSQYGKSTKDQFLRDLPRLGTLIQQLENEWKRNGGWIKGLDGRPIFVDSPHKVLNSLLQSDEAIQMGAAYCWLNMKLDQKYEFGKDYGMLVWYHDEFVVEALPEIVDDVRQLSEQSIEWAGKFYKITIKHEGSSAIGYNWKEVH